MATQQLLAKQTAAGLQVDGGAVLPLRLERSRQQPRPLPPQPALQPAACQRLRLGQGNAEQLLVPRCKRTTPHSLSHRCRSSGPGRWHCPPAPAHPAAEWWYAPRVRPPHPRPSSPSRPAWQRWTAARTSCMWARTPMRSSTWTAPCRATLVGARAGGDALPLPRPPSGRGGALAGRCGDGEREREQILNSTLSLASCRRPAALGGGCSSRSSSSSAPAQGHRSAVAASAAFRPRVSHAPCISQGSTRLA